MNKAILIGNVGQAPEVKVFENGNKLVSVSIATNERWKDKTTGEQKERGTWHFLQFGGPLADVVEKYVNKGDKISIVGKIDNYEFTDAQGVKKYGSRINVQEMEMLTPKGGAGQNPSAQPSPEMQAAAENDDLPF